MKTKLSEFTPTELLRNLEFLIKDGEAIRQESPELWTDKDTEMLERLKVRFSEAKKLWAN